MLKTGANPIFARYVQRKHLQKYVWILKHWNQITNPIKMLSGKLKDGLKMYLSLRGARATGLCQIGKSSAPGIKQHAKAVRIVLL
jgi:hypothetical protein